MIDAALAPAVLDEIEAKLRCLDQPMDAAAATRRLLYIAETNAGGKPLRDLFILAAAVALHGAAQCAGHFGLSPDYTPGCVDRLTPEEYRRRSALIRLAIAAEDTRRDAARAEEQIAMAAMQTDHVVALRREEEAGYARGLRDERERCLRIIARIKAGLRNGGARNACDAIAGDLNEGRDG